MGNFWVVIPSGEGSGEAERMFRSGLEAARRIRSQEPSQVIEREWGRAALFARKNGSGAALASDPETGSWLLAVGTWFHISGYASSEELKLLRRHLEVGADRLGAELEGFFVIVIGDARTQQTVVITDLIGSCHCFMRSHQDAVAVSGSSLLLASLGDYRLDRVACQEFLHTGIIHENRTIYREVRKLGPSSVFRFARGALRAEQRYWSITNLTPESLDGRPAAKRLWETLVHVAARVGKTFSRPVCDLTGGYDSRALAAAFLAAGVPFSTCVSGPAESADVVVSRGLAQLAGLSHSHLEAPPQADFAQICEALSFTDGEYDLVEYARVLDIHRALMERFEVSINGSFGEVARGYWWELLVPRTGARQPLDAQKVARLRYAAMSGDPSLFPPQTRLDLVSHLADVIGRTNAGLTRCPNTLQMDHAYLFMRMQRWQGRIASSTNQVWPCLSPFMFRSVLEILLETRAQFRKRSLLVREMLAAFRPQWADYPLEHGYPAIPATWKNLHRFTPLAGYYGKKVVAKARGLLGLRVASSSFSSATVPLRLQLWSQEQPREILNPTEMKSAGLFDKAALTSFLARSRETDFPYNDQWTRLLSLEYTLRVLEPLGARPAD